MTAHSIPDDEECPECGAEPVGRTCVVCRVSAWITDCGHMAQPRPIAAGREDGSDLHRDYCESCAREKP